MLASISPLGERARNARWWRTTTAYLLSSTLGGAAMGAALGGIGEGVRHAAAGRRPLVDLALAVALAGAFADITRRLPTVHRQVDENWLTRYRDWVYGAGFGFQLGVAAATIVTSAATYLTWALELAVASPVGGALVGATFGLARGVPLLAMVDITTPEALRRRNQAVVAALPVAARVVATAQLAAAAGLAVLVAVG